MITRAKFQRLQMGLTQRQVCDIVGASTKWLSAFELGRLDIDAMSYGRGTALEMLLGDILPVLVQRMPEDVAEAGGDDEI